MVANQSACLANLATLFYILAVFSVGTFIGQKTYKSMLNNNFLFAADINGMDDDISVKYMRGGVNTSIDRKLAAVHGNAIWGVIRNNEFWEEYQETNENDEEKLGADLRAQIAERKLVACDGIINRVGTKAIATTGQQNLLLLTPSGA